MNTVVGVLAAAVAAVGSWTAMPGGSWTPPRAAIQQIQANLKPFVAQQAAKEKVKLAEWTTYTFQYQGQEEKGRKFIFVNAYCSKPDPEYSETKMLLVFDGGPCYFTLKYDPAKKAFFDLWFNGEA